MEKILERFSLGHLLGVIAPGLTALALLLFRSGWDVPDVLGHTLSASPTVEGAFVLIVAYGLGLLLLEFANAGAKFYLNLKLRRMTNLPVGSPLHRMLAEPVKFLSATVFFWIPLPRLRASFVDVQIMMSEFNESTSNTFEIARISSPFTTLELFRKLIPRRKMENVDTVLDQAAELHNRLLFALSVSLVLTCIALCTAWDALINVHWGWAIRENWNTALRAGWGSAFRAICDSVFQWAKAGHLNKSRMFVLVAAGLGSYCLRVVAARCWELELILVSSLARRRD